MLTGLRGLRTPSLNFATFPFPTLCFFPLRMINEIFHRIDIFHGFEKHELKKRMKSKSFLFLLIIIITKLTVLRWEPHLRPSTNVFLFHYKEY